MMSPFEIANLAWYAWRRNSWMVDPRFYLGRYREVTIDRPIFLLGNQGAGLTLVSRMLRRHPSVVSPSGNHRYWSGADEMHNVFEPALSPKIGGTQFKAPSHPTLTPPRGWTYAADELIDLYRETEKDVDDHARRSVRRVVRYCLGRFGNGSSGPSRFVDKSQVFTVRLGLIWKIFREYDPKFVLVTRNPYAACYRAAAGKAGDMRRFRDENVLSFDERFELCIQHWQNAMGCVLADVDRLDLSVPIIQFEEILRAPERTLRELCDAVDLGFQPAMLPEAGDEIPFGSRFRDRWHPLRPDVNEPYFESMLPEHVEKIQERCGDLAERLEYTPPNRL